MKSLHDKFGYGNIGKALILIGFGSAAYTIKICKNAKPFRINKELKSERMDTTMSNVFDSRRKPMVNNGYEAKGLQKKNGIYYTSKMQGILTEKEANEGKAAVWLSEYLLSIAEVSPSEVDIMNRLNGMLEGFTIEEKNRILSKALINALCKIS